MVGREPGDAAFISSSRYRASSLTYPADRPREVRLPTYTGRIGEYLSIGWGLTLEVSTETLLDTIDQARFLLFRVTPISFLKTFTHSQVGLGMILSGDAKELDKLLAKLSQKLERSFAISERQENSFELLLDRHIRKDRRYEVLTATTKRNLLRITEKFRSTTFLRLRQELREPKAKSSLLSIIRNAVDHRPDRPKADTAATLLFRELLKYSQRTVNDIDTAEEAWKRGIDDIRNNLLEADGILEARGLHSRIEALYSEAQDLEPRKFNQSFQSLESIKCDVFATIDGPTKVIAFLESWIKDHHSKRTKAIQYESDQAKVNGSSLQT